MRQAQYGTLWPNAHHIPTMGSQSVSTGTRLPTGTVALRLGWAQTQTVSESIFTRAGNHPIDGAAEGVVSGLGIPPFPPALNTDTSLYSFIWIGTDLDNIADIRLSGGGGTLIGSYSSGEAFTVDGVAGTVFVSNQRLSSGLSAYQISAIVAGDLIASQPWTTQQNTEQTAELTAAIATAIDAIPAGGFTPGAPLDADSVVLVANQHKLTSLLIPGTDWFLVLPEVPDDHAGSYCVVSKAELMEVTAVGPNQAVMSSNRLRLYDVSNTIFYLGRSTSGFLTLASTTGFTAGLRIRVL